MPSYTIKVPNNDEGEDLGEYESDYLPRVGDPFTLWHPRLDSAGGRVPFCGIVSAVQHEAHYDPTSASTVKTTVWLVEEHAPPKLYCDCFKEVRAQFGVDEDGDCENCGHARRA